MPTHKVKGGYQWGKHGKVYPTKKQADKQGQAIYASGWRENKEYTNMKKQIVRLTENDLHRIINESVSKILKEDLDNNNSLINELLNIKNDIDEAIKSCENGNAKAAIFDLSGASSTLRYLIRVLS